MCECGGGAAACIKEWRGKAAPLKTPGILATQQWASII